MLGRVGVEPTANFHLFDTDAHFYVRRRGFPNLSEQIAKKVEMRTTGYYSVVISRMRRSNDSRGVSPGA